MNLLIGTVHCRRQVLKFIIFVYFSKKIFLFPYVENTTNPENFFIFTTHTYLLNVHIIFRLAQALDYIYVTVQYNCLIFIWAPLYIYELFMPSLPFTTNIPLTRAWTFGEMLLVYRVLIKTSCQVLIFPLLC